MTPQQIFDKAYIGLTKQGRPSLNDVGCAYLSNEGLRCGVGMLLDDATARKFDTIPTNAQGTGISSCIRRYASTIPAWIGENIPLLCGIQSAHDDPDKFADDWVQQMQRRMKVVASGYELTVPA